MKYVRRPEVVRPVIVKTKEGLVLCKQACKIQVPVRFAEKGLAVVGIQTFVYGLFPIILATGEYTLMNVTAMIELCPTRTTTVDVNGEEYYEFQFDAGTSLFKSAWVRKDDSIMFKVIDEFVFLGKLPWYVGYDDCGRLLDTSLKYAGSRVGQNPETPEFLASIIGRPKTDRATYLRHAATSYKDVEIDKVSYVPLKSVYYAVNSTLNKLTGSYMRAGIDSALVTPTTSVDKVESILRA